MPRRTFLQSLTLAAVIGSLAAMSSPARAADPVENVWAKASPVQAYGSAPANRMPGQAAAVQLHNDASTGTDVHFLLDGQEQTLSSGQTLDLSGDRPHLIEFNSGGNYGDLRFTLYQGLYKFKVMPEGWALFKASSDPSMAGRSMAPGAQSPGTRTQVQRGYTPPMPAEDLRTRRMAVRSEGTAQPQGTRPLNTPQPPSAQIGAGQNPAPTIATPPQPGVTRERTNAPRTP
jgi:hypothetical protein